MLTEPPAKPRRTLTPILITTLALTAAGITAWQLQPTDTRPATPGTFRITGRIATPKIAPRVGQLYGGAPCTPTDGYDDVPGAQVVITDAQGTVIATGQLSQGFVELDPTDPYGEMRRCGYSFAIDGIPDGGSFYGVAIGRRGSLQYSREDLRAPLQLTLK